MCGKQCQRLVRWRYEKAGGDESAQSASGSSPRDESHVGAIIILPGSSGRSEGMPKAMPVLTAPTPPGMGADAAELVLSGWQSGTHRKSSRRSTS